jgi:hypothetical protein
MIIATDLNAKAARKIGFPLSKELVERELIIAQGTTTAKNRSTPKVPLTLQDASCLFDHGEAFCLLNEQHCSSVLLDQNWLKDFNY